MQSVTQRRRIGYALVQTARFPDSGSARLKETRCIFPAPRRSARAAVGLRWPYRWHCSHTIASGKKPLWFLGATIDPHTKMLLIKHRENRAAGSILAVPPGQRRSQFG